MLPRGGLLEFSSMLGLTLLAFFFKACYGVLGLLLIEKLAFSEISVNPESEHRHKCTPYLPTAAFKASFVPHKTQQILPT